MTDDLSCHLVQSNSAKRRMWTAPAVIDLPTLTDLTLQSAGGAPPAGDAVTVTGGSSGLVF